MMKMILLITNKDDVTVDFIVKELQKRSIVYYRLNTEDIPNRISIKLDINKDDFKLHDRIKDKTICLSKIEAIYYRRPCINDFEYIPNLTNQEKRYLEVEMTFLLEGIYKILKDRYWLNNVYDIREAENKLYQLQLAKLIGFNIPISLISNLHDDISKLCKGNDYNCIIKPIKSGNMKDTKNPKAIFTTLVNETMVCDKQRVESFPLFMQTNINKKFDLRCTVVDDMVFAAEIHSQTNDDTKIDWRKGEQRLEHKVHNLPNDIKSKCIKLTKKLNLNYSAIDLIVDENNNYIFLEINPNGQWAWIEKRLNLPISQKIVDTLIKGVV